MNRSILLSIHPEHAENIYSNKKRAELRKSFSDQFSGLIFLYETNPKCELTGAIFTNGPIHASSQEILKLSESFGVPPDRAEKYFTDRKHGWIIPVDLSIRFKTPVPLSDLKLWDHYFSVPQAYSYLYPGDPIFVELRDLLFVEFEKRVKIQKVTEANTEELKKLVYNEVKPFYENIDADFVRQILEAGKGEANSFSTAKKIVTEFSISNTVLGYSVLTEKSYGAMKTGPTIIKKPYRSIGLSLIIRNLIDQFCKEKGSFEVYCSSPSTKPEVIGGLIKSGYSVQAVLDSHLEGTRNEFILAKRLSPSDKVAYRENSKTKKKYPKWYKYSQLGSSENRFQKVVELFSKLMKDWYFQAPPKITESISRSIQIYEKGKYTFSDKPRILFIGNDVKSSKKALVLCTLKRSNMLKMNVATSESCPSLFEGMIRYILENTNFRRYYCTIPSDKIFVLTSFLNIGFHIEGVLEDPFNNGIDHFCIGLTRNTSRISASQK